MDVWMQSSAAMRKKYLNVALPICRVVNREDGSYHVDAAEDDDGLDGIE